MHVAKTIAEVRERVAAWRVDGARVALVPTMGNLHRGHLALVAAAARHADKVAASVFVNPLQFDREDDLAAYPRTPDADLERLRESGVALAFTPACEEMYPLHRGGSVRVDPGELGAILCGAHRPGHFAGVATAVVKLFNIFAPDVAVFGEKDYQQWVLVRRLAECFDFAVRIVAVPTVREDSGLALSSRNARLDEAQKAQAAALYRVLRATAAAVRAAAGPAALRRLTADARRSLERAGLSPDYVEIRDAQTLAPVDAATDGARCIVLAAVRLGEVRLIDNVIVGADA